MARQQSKIQTNNFSGGFVTEASPLSFPENSAIDILNMDINRDGSIERRNALDDENNPAGITSGAYPSEYNKPIVSYVWRNASGYNGANFVVVYDAGNIHFFHEGDNVVSGWQHTDAFLKVVETIDNSIDDKPVSFAEVYGYLVIAHRYAPPIYVVYDPDNTAVVNGWSGGGFVFSTIDIRVRDLDGLEDGLKVDQRPPELSDEHKYNLINQGWNDSKITEFHTSQSLYPSNADIWSAGRDANNNFDPAEMVKVHFGTSAAPKGTIIESPFNTTKDSTQFLDSPRFVENAEIINSTTIELTVSAHGLTGTDSIYVEDLFILCDGSDPDGNGNIYASGSSIDEEFANVISVTSPDKFRIGINSCSPDRLVIYDTAFIHKEWVSVPDVGYITNERPTSVASYAGRVFYAGTEFGKLTNRIFFSQIITDEKRFGKCYQEADPTSEEDSQLVDTDGGVIDIAGLGKVLHMRESNQSLVIFATNGVWEIKGGGEGYFTAKDFAVRKVSSTPVLSHKGIVEVEGTLLFATEEGLYILQPNEVSLSLNATNLTQQSINSFYIENIVPCACNLRAVYDYKNRDVLWLYGNIPDGNPNADKRFALSNVLKFNLDTQSFTKHSYPFDWNSVDNTINIMDAISIRNISKGESCIRYIYRKKPSIDGILEFCKPDKPKEEGFVDLDKEEMPSYVYTGYATMGDVGVKKSARQIIAHFLRTEKGFTENQDGGLDFVHPSGCRMRVAWDWSNSSASNKWGQEFQAYRYRQLYMPENFNDPFDTGYEVITTKTKLRGTGRALNIRLRSEEGKDMVLLGWSIAGDAEAHE